MKIDKLVVFTVLIQMFTTQIQASVIPGKWEKVESLSQGYQIVVTLKSGDQIEGSYQGDSPEELTVTDQKNETRQIPKAEVALITSRNKVGDSLANGALIGSAAGFGAGFLGFIVANNAVTASGDWWDGEAAAYATCLGLVGAGIGLIIGSSVDGAMRRQELIYQAY